MLAPLSRTLFNSRDARSQTRTARLTSDLGVRGKREHVKTSISWRQGALPAGAERAMRGLTRFAARDGA
jgi:hypothetical protein